jgi:two-component system chemotaxis response regulator CheB
MSIFRGLDHKITIPMVIVQHMPPVFTSRMAVSLSGLSEVVVKEASKSDVLISGVCYVAPGDYHLVINRDQTLSVNQSEKVCYVRPSVDVFLNSVTENFKGKILTIILTGMGYDGASGCSLLAKRDNIVLAQDQKSSVVWGMPGAVCENGSAKYALPLEYFPEIINKLSAR